eukprot:TRINITY_DN78776_c0_g1_i1.p1 TRINITY_DN78776_c0_g1~~TRINITY_DN78776_c0_g1_i1.p1  ORF type:complete len:595 (-),score=167.61 TRINITY_DN78776_c0_g1_i1:32-1816(-)
MYRRSVTRAVGSVRIPPRSPACLGSPCLNRLSASIGVPMSPRSWLSSSYPSHIKLTMPALSPTMSEGNLAKWRKKEGDKVNAGDVLAEVETDKATVDFESVEEGYIARILLPEGSNGVKVGALVAILAESESDIVAFKDFSESAAPAVPAPAAAPTSEPVAAPSSATSYPSHIKLPMPALSPTMSEGNLGKWRKKEGDKVNAGDVLAEVETDKATVDFESVEDGFLAKILVQEGASGVKVGKLVAILVENEADIVAFKDFSESAASGPAPASKPSAVSTSAISSSSSAPASSSGRVFASPLAKKLASEKSLNLGSIHGTGYEGRIVAADVLEYKPAPAVVKPAVAAASPASADVTEKAPESGNFEDLPLSLMRKSIAKRLLESKSTIPHYYLTIELNVDKLLKLRAELNSRIAEGEPKLSVNDFLIKAAAAALKKVPAVNSSWTDKAIRQYNYVDISVAVSTEAGLITPIVFDADKKGLSVISKDVKELAGKARANKLKPQEFQGGTFTISNLGMFGVNQFAAIINPPQSAILAVGTTSKKVVPNEGDSEDPFKTISAMNVTLSADHRVVDGAVGAQWLSEFKKFVEDPILLIL